MPTAFLKKDWEFEFRLVLIMHFILLIDNTSRQLPVNVTQGRDAYELRSSMFHETGDAS